MQLVWKVTDKWYFRAYPGSEFVVANTLAKWKKLEPNEINSARSHTFVEIDYEIISMVILLPSAESFKKDCSQLLAKVCAQSTD